MTPEPLQPHGAGAPQSVLQQVAGTAAVLGTSYAALLAVLERRLAIVPNWVALEVIGGVLLVGLPVMRTARATSDVPLTWRDYERMVMLGFIATGAPICLWQLLEHGVLRRRRSAGQPE